MCPAPFRLLIFLCDASSQAMIIVRLILDGKNGPIPAGTTSPVLLILASRLCRGSYLVIIFRISFLFLFLPFLNSVFLDVMGEINKFSKLEKQQVVSSFS